MDIIKLYKEGNSIPEISLMTGKHRSTVRYNLKKSGVLRSRIDGIKNAAKKGRLGGGNKGKKIVFSDEWKKNISIGKIKHADQYAIGKSLKPSGYIEITRGENKGRPEHCVIVESIIGRRLFTNECIHHKDFDRSNNEVCNLRLMTKSEHARLHREFDKSNRKRDLNGRF